MTKYLFNGTKKRIYCIKHESAQALMEVAILLPILLILVLGTFDFGRVLFFKIVTTNAAREGANYISRNTDDKTKCSTTNPIYCYKDTVDIVLVEADSSGLTLIPTDVLITDCCTSGSAVTVTVSKSINLMFERTLILLKIINGPITINSAARMMVQ
ncbi:MAG: hypothetical protein C0410_02945 [Anaerolinea sp.]|nr:hypothetical protein [Anaerolinea sp.]